MKEKTNSQDLDVRLRKKMNYLIGVFADESGMYPDEARSELKTELKRTGIIKSSTSELDIKELIVVCNLLVEWIVKWKKQQKYGNNKQQ